ncbi:MAG: hypothetical protein AAB910_01245 [Patescibacteria group bacterium]
MSGSLPVLCSFYTPIEPALVSFEVPKRMLRACRVLDGQIMPLDKALERLRKASKGIGEVAVEDGLISWKIQYSVAEIADGTERALDLAERDDGAPSQGGLIWNEGESRWMTNAEVRQLIWDMRQSGDESTSYAVLIRYKPVGKLKAN